MALLDGKVALVTGAAGGLGRGYAWILARHGAAVVLNDTGGARDGSGSTAAAQGLANELRAAGFPAASSDDDISDRSGAQRAVDVALSTFGRLDILMNNAGILRDKTLLKMDDDMWDSVLRAHARGSYLCSQLAARWMVQHQVRGRIINTTSVSGPFGHFGQTNYAAATAALYGLTLSTHLERYPRHGITVNAVAAVALTRMTEGLPMMQALGESVPGVEQRLGAERIAPVVLFLASDAAAEISGTIVGVQGEQLCRYVMGQSGRLTPREGNEWGVPEPKKRRGELTT